MPISFNEYQQRCNDTAIYDDDYYPFASLMIEAAEFADLVTKIQLRGDDGHVDRGKLMAEAGDVLWDLAECLSQYNIDLQDVADYNLSKLASRKVRGVLTGNGGDR